MNLGVCLRVVGRTERAIECFERAVALDGSQAQALRHLVDLHGAAGRPEAAEAARARLQELLGRPGAAPGPPPAAPPGD